MPTTGGFGRGGAVGTGCDAVREVATTLTNQMDQIDQLLGRSASGTFSVLAVMFETNYAEQINRLRRLRARHDTDFPDIVDDSTETLIDRLQELDIARQYFKTIYFQQELSTLTRWLLYTGLPAEAVLIGSLFFLTVPADQPASIAVPLELLIPVTITVGLVLLAVLASFFWRTATVTSLTAATLPFTTPEQER